MNWLEIDRLIRGLIQAGNSPENIKADLRKQFSWTESQAEHAVNPLVKRTPVLQKKRTSSKVKKAVDKKKK